MPQQKIEDDRAIFILKCSGITDITYVMKFISIGLN